MAGGSTHSGSDHSTYLWLSWLKLASRCLTNWWLAAREMPGLGLVANLVEFPAVGRGLARFRLQVMAGHADAEIEAAAERVGAALGIARERLGAGGAAAGPRALAG